jgi:hypothetical protein
MERHVSDLVSGCSDSVPLSVLCPLCIVGCSDLVIKLRSRGAGSEPVSKFPVVNLLSPGRFLLLSPLRFPFLSPGRLPRVLSETSARRGREELHAGHWREVPAVGGIAQGLRRGYRSEISFGAVSRVASILR